MAELEDEDMATVDVSHDDAGVPVVTLAGEIDISSIERLVVAMEPVLTPAGRVIIDLSAVEFFDSSGLTMLLEARARVGALVLRNPSEVVRRVIEVSGLDQTLATES